MQTAKITTSNQLVFAKVITALLPQNSVMSIEIPAEAIKATTAGLREFRIPCKSVRFLYFKYSLAMQVTMMQDGRMHPKVAARAPPMPAIFIPTQVADLMAMGHGVICEIVIRSVIASIESQ